MDTVSDRLRSAAAGASSDRPAPVDYQRLRADLVRCVARVCPSWMADRRDDVVQAAVMRVMRSVEQTPHVEGDSRLGTSYLYKVAYTALVDEIRRVQRRRETLLEDEGADPVRTARPDPEQVAAAREAGRGIQDCLRQLSHDRRLAVTLYLQGHTVPEAARLLACAAKRAENLVYRGLAELRACLLSKGIRP